MACSVKITIQILVYQLTKKHAISILPLKSQGKITERHMASPALENPSS